jgi:prefoldin subunit 5
MSISNTSKNIKNKYLETLDKIRSVKIRYYLLLAILIGIIIGYSINNNITAPKITDLSNENEEMKNQITMLMNNITDLQHNYQDLETRYSELSETYEEVLDTYIPMEDYNILEEQYSSLEKEIESLEEIIEELNDDIDSLTELNIELIDDYNKLIIKYNKLKPLKWVFFVVEGLEVNLTTTKISYSELEDIIGTITIEDNKKPFEGEIEFRVFNVLQDAGTSGFSHEIDGEVDYLIHNGFIFGPGQYTLGLSKIIDSEGNVIATIDELKEYKILIAMG